MAYQDRMWYHMFVLRPLPRSWKIVLIFSVIAIFTAGLSSRTEAIMPACVNLLANSSLENANQWLAQSNGNYTLLSSALAHSGKQVAYLAGVDNASDLLSTRILLPAHSASLTLQFWWQIHSQEQGRAQDQMAVIIADPEGRPIKYLLSLGSNSASNQWQQQQVDLQEFASQTIELQFAASTDATQPTDFFVDDIEIIGCRGGQ